MSFFGALLDYTTPLLSTADAGSDGLFLYQNWGTDADDGETHPQSYSVLVQGLGLEDDGEEDDDTNIEETRKGWFPRLRLKSRLNALTDCGMPMVELLVQFLLVLLLLVLLLPVGQLLPIVLWLQAKQEVGKAPKRPIKPEQPPEPPCPQDLKALNAGKQPAGQDFYKMYQLAKDHQKEPLMDYFREFRDWKKEFTEWHFTEYLPYLDRKDRYFQWEMKVKVSTHLPFVVETTVEAIPQSLLQTTAIVIESQRNPGAISWVQFASIGVSMVSIASKAYIACNSMIRAIFNFKMICLFADLGALFYTVAAFWSTRRGDKDAVDMFFLTRPVDPITASYLWIAFLWSCLFALWLLLRSIALIFDWLFLNNLFYFTLTEKERRSNFGAVYGSMCSIAAKWPTDLSFVEIHDHSNCPSFDPSKTPACSMFVFFLTSCFLTLVAVACGLVVIIIPVLILLFLPRMFWICLWIKRMESEMHEATELAPIKLSRDDIMERMKPQKIGEIGGKVFLDTDHEARCFLFIADLPEALGAEQSRVDIDLKDFLISRFGSAPLQEAANEGDAQEAPTFWVLIKPTEFYTQMKMHEDAEAVPEQQQRKSSFYTQSFAWTLEGKDFFARLSALKHGLIWQHVEDLQELSKTAKVSLPGCLFLRFFGKVIANIAGVYSLLQAPLDVLPHWDRRLFSAFASLRKNALTKVIDALQDKQLEKDEQLENQESKQEGHEGGGDLEDEFEVSSIGSEGIELPNDIVSIKHTEVYARLLTSCRGLGLYMCLYKNILLPFGWLVQKLLIVVTALVATGSLLFPTVSFSLACWHAIQDNYCSDSRIFRGDVAVSQSTLIYGVRSLFNEDCYTSGGKPINLFRAMLFLCQALLLVIAIVYGAFAARPFIIFAMVVPKYDLIVEDSELRERIQHIYERIYATDQDSSAMQDLVGDEEKEESEVEPEVDSD